MIGKNLRAYVQCRAHPPNRNREIVDFLPKSSGFAQNGRPMRSALTDRPRIGKNLLRTCSLKQQGRAVAWPCWTSKNWAKYKKGTVPGGTWASPSSVEFAKLKIKRQLARKLVDLGHQGGAMCKFWGLGAVDLVSTKNRKFHLGYPKKVDQIYQNYSVKIQNWACRTLPALAIHRTESDLGRFLPILGRIGRSVRAALIGWPLWTGSNWNREIHAFFKKSRCRAIPPTS